MIAPIGKVLGEGNCARVTEGGKEAGAKAARLRTETSYAEPENTLGGTCSASPNRLMRSRMSGGVGRAVSNGRPYPISSTADGTKINERGTSQ